MSELNPHFRNLQLHQLIDENEQLRRQAGKHAQIEHYVGILLEELQDSQEQRRVCGLELRRLQARNQELEQLTSRLRLEAEEEMRIIFAQHDQAISQQDIQLRELKSQLEIQHRKTVQLEDRIYVQGQREESTVTSYETALKTYRHDLSNSHHDLHRLQKTVEETLAHKEQLSNQLATLRTVLASKTTELEQIKRLSASIEGDYSRMVNHNRQLQQRMKHKEEQADALLQKMEISLDLIRGELQREQKERDVLLRLNDKLEGEIAGGQMREQMLRNEGQTNTKKLGQLEKSLLELSQENRFLREKMKQIDRLMLNSIEGSKREFSRMIDEKQELEDKLKSKERGATAQLAEIKDLLLIVTNLEGEVKESRAAQQCAKAELQECKSNWSRLSTQWEQQQLCMKEDAENTVRLREYLRTAEEDNQKLKQELARVATDNHRLSRQLNHPREMGRDYLLKIEKLGQEFAAEREQMREMHTREKKQIKQLFQFQLREREAEFQRKIAELLPFIPSL